MKSIKIINGSVKTEIGHYHIKSINPKRLILGKTLRNIQGDIIGYNNGNKKEYSISLTEICEDIFNIIDTLYLEQTEVIVEITNDITNNTESITALIELSGHTYDNQKDLYEINMRVLQV